MTTTTATNARIAKLPLFYPDKASHAHATRVNLVSRRDDFDVHAPDESQVDLADIPYVTPANDAVQSPTALPSLRSSTTELEDLGRSRAVAGANEDSQYAAL
jgi:hypothetical protein